MILFYGWVTPAALASRAFRRPDSLRARAFRTGRDSVLVRVDHRYGPDDFAAPGGGRAQP